MDLKEQSKQKIYDYFNDVDISPNIYYILG